MCSQASVKILAGLPLTMLKNMLNSTLPEHYVDPSFKTPIRKMVNLGKKAYKGKWF